MHHSPVPRCTWRVYGNSLMVGWALHLKPTYMTLHLHATDLQDVTAIFLCINSLPKPVLLQVVIPWCHLEMEIIPRIFNVHCIFLRVPIKPVVRAFHDRSKFSPVTIPPYLKVHLFQQQWIMHLLTVVPPSRCQPIELQYIVVPCG